MSKLLFAALFTSVNFIGFAQLNFPTFYFSGQVIDADSIPVEHAYLVNYQTLRAYATNTEGRFRIPFQTGDSLKLVHISYQPKIIKPSVTDTTIIVCFEENELGMVTAKYVDIELQNFYRNWETINLQIKEMSRYNYRNSKVQNPYDANQFTGTTGIRISDIIDLFKTKN